MGEPGRTAAVAAWWRGLSSAWRANVGLYALAIVALLALLVQLAVGGDKPPQRVEVASRAPATTALSAPRLQPPTTPGPSTTVAAAPSTTAAPAPTPGPAPPATPDPPVPLSVDTPPSEEPTTIPGPTCRNSVDPACGAFFWDPPPAPNRGLKVSVSPSSTTPSTADTVTFRVTVTDPDHRVTDYCAKANYGDGSAIEARPCTRAPCPEPHGPWSPPPAATDTQEFTFSHRYQGTGQHTPSFEFHTDFDAPCPNPYGSIGSAATVVTVHSP